MAEDLRNLDLHMHSTVSDGTDTPEELLVRVREAGLALFSVTDHDAALAAKRIRAVAGPDDPAFIPGVEFSCQDEAGKYHILGYGFDPDNPEFSAVIERGHSLRMMKAKARLDFLTETFGFVFPDEEIRKLLSLNNPGKPHIANLMVRLGYAADKKQAIDDYINKKKFEDAHVRPDEAIRGILRGGGIPVLAHPLYGDGDQLLDGPQLEERLKHLCPYGLEGVESFYSGFSDKQIRIVLDLAAAFGLYLTAGSDYHGSNKLVMMGDTGLNRAAEYPDGLRRFLRDVRARI